jgi:serine protease Do
MNHLLSALADEANAVVGQVQRSLVVLRNGRRGYGAGFIWRSDGLIVTNNHVVGKARTLAVTSDGNEYPPKILARDPQIDLALLKIEADDLPAAVIGDSRLLQVGEIVMAVGHPWGQPGAVTAGCISALGKAQTSGKRRGELVSVDIIRSDVRLAPGNSGGPLVDARGSVVGINTMLVGGDQGIALPSHVVEAFIENQLGDDSCG